MKNLSYYTILLSSLILGACQETFDPFEASNKKPQIHFKSPYQKDFSDFKKDSVKLGNTYVLGFKVDDEEDLEPQIVSNCTLNYSNNSYQVKPDQEGTFQFSFEVNDSYGIKDQKSFELVCFKNLPPVANASAEIIAILSPMERKINALSSYDKDQKYGGKIEAWEFTISGNKPVINNKGYLMHIFPESGSCRVKTRVQDNDQVWSEAHYFNVFIE